MNIIDTLNESLNKERDSLHERRLKLKAGREKLEPLLTELQALGCDFSFPNTIDVNLTGDKHKFLALLRVLNKHGLKTPKIEKGAIGFSEFFYLKDVDISLWMRFSSTVCRRVKVGTKTIQQDVYETICDEIYSYDEVSVAMETADEIPF